MVINSSPAIGEERSAPVAIRRARFCTVSRSAKDDWASCPYTSIPYSIRGRTRE